MLSRRNCSILIKPRFFDRLTKENAIEDGSLNELNQRNTEVLERGDRKNNNYSNSSTNGPDVENGTDEMILLSSLFLLC